MKIRENFGKSFRRTFQFKYLIALLIEVPIICLFFILSCHIRYIYIFFFILCTIIIGVLLTYIWFYSQKHSKKERFIISLLSFGLLFLPILYILTFVHEMGHALVAIFRGIPIIDFIVNINGSGFVLTPLSTPNLDMIMISIAGSSSEIIFNVIIIGIIYTRKILPIEIFLTLFSISGYKILSQIGYWISGIIHNFGDAAVFLSVNPSVDPDRLLFVLYYAYFFVLLVVLLLFSYKLLTRAPFYLKEIFPDLRLNFCFK